MSDFRESPLFLQSIDWRSNGALPEGFPFDVPVVRSFSGIALTSKITFFVGENGSGKSTLLEAIACAIGSVTVGSESVETDTTLADIRRLADAFKLSWSRKTRAGFFMRAEDFFGYAKSLARLRQEMEDDLSRIDREYRGRSKMARSLARMPYAREMGGLQRSYGDGLDANSHGEGFLKLFQARFAGEGLYLLDEPEAPLSPTRQLSLLTLLKMMIDRGAQFIIATHSPILLAYPGASILSFDHGTIAPIAYEDLDHYRVTRDFLNNPEVFLRVLLADE